MALSLSNLLNPVEEEKPVVEQREQAPTPAPELGDETVVKVETTETVEPEDTKPKRPKPKNSVPRPKKRKVDEVSVRSNTPVSVKGKSTPARKSSTPIGDDEEVYCICRKPDDSRWMIACDGGCDDWFHGSCVQMDQADGDLIDRYICPNCKKAGKGDTIWKPMCRLPGCRRPARLAKTSPSKYCSDEHGEEFMRLRIASSAPTLAAGGPLRKGELAALSKRPLTEFKELGDAIPHVDQPEYSSDEQARLDAIAEEKSTLQKQRQLLKDREAFLQIAKERAKKLAKAHCGYDPRLSWSEGDVAKWQQETGIQFLEKSWYAKLAEITPRGAPAEDEDVCRKRDCARHHAWAKVQLEDIRFEEVTLAEANATLKEEERAIIEGALLRQASSGEMYKN